MPLIFHAFGAYATYSQQEASWRQQDYDVCKLVKALKGEEFRGYATMRHVSGNWLRFTHQNPENAWRIFAAWGAQRLVQLNLGHISLVRVPSSKTVRFDQDDTPFRMAVAVQSLMGSQCVVEPWLRFRHEMPSSHNEQGTRNQAIIRAALEVSPTLRRSKIVLIDDVKTTGSHLRACAQILRDAGATVNVALAAGFTVLEQVPDPLNVQPSDIE